MKKTTLYTIKQIRADGAELVLLRPHYSIKACENDIKKMLAKKWVQKGGYRFEVIEMVNPY